LPYQTRSFDSLLKEELDHELLTSHK